MKKQALYITSACFSGYTVCYMARGVLSAIMPEMTAAGAAERDILAFAGSLFFLSYGIGQLINGILGDYIRAKFIISGGLLISAIALFAFPSALVLDKSGSAVCMLWCACGFALSMLWGPMTKVIAENIPEENGVKCMTALTVASILGTTVTYLVSAAASAVKSWQSAFYVTGILTLAGCVLAFVLLHIPEKRGLLVMIRREKRGKRKTADGESAASFRELTAVLLSGAIIPMLIISFTNGVLRNAVSFWIPTYITENLSVTPSVAAILSAVLTFVNLAGTYAGLYMLRRFKGNEAGVIATLFAFSAAAFVLMYAAGDALPVAKLILLFSASAAMSSVCNLIYSKYCLRFAKTGRASVISGSLDFISYIASAIASALFEITVRTNGWGFTVMIWAAVAAVGLLSSVWTVSIFKKGLRRAPDKSRTGM